MEPIRKKTKITGHFRVALKPQDVNIQPGLKKLKLHHDIGKENVEVITISDDEDDDDDFKKNKKDSNRIDHLMVKKTKQQQQPIQSQLQEQQQPQDKSICRKKEATILEDDRERVIKQQSHLFAHFSSFRGKRSKFQNIYIAPPGIHSKVVDHDKSLLDDILYEPHYAWDSFNYDREQELKYTTRSYLEDAHHGNQITPLIRARLVDWLVQIQSNYSLYHEPLYMAVKIADHYLMKKTVPRQQLQLLYMTAILISAKFDERLPPVEIDDLIQQSAGVYTREQVIAFEVDILTTLDFNIRFPLSYVFLRRFARCTSSDQKTLLLARFILESSLLDYEMIEVLESKIAAASLLLAFHMLHLDDAWNETAEFYTGYKQEELDNLSQKLNHMIARPTDKRISTVRKKYSHGVFLSVAKIPPLPTR